MAHLCALLCPSGESRSGRSLRLRDFCNWRIPAASGRGATAARQGQASAGNGKTAARTADFRGIRRIRGRSRNRPEKSDGITEIWKNRHPPYRNRTRVSFYKFLLTPRPSPLISCLAPIRPISRWAVSHSESPTWINSVSAAATNT